MTTARLLPALFVLAFGTFILVSDAVAAETVVAGIVKWTLPEGAGWKVIARRVIESGEMYIYMERGNVTVELHGIRGSGAPSSKEAFQEWLLTKFYQRQVLDYSEGFGFEEEEGKRDDLMLPSGATITRQFVRINGHSRHVAVAGSWHGRLWIGIFFGMKGSSDPLPRKELVDLLTGIKLGEDTPF